MDFPTAYARYAAEVARLSRTQRVPGLDAEDVENEMLIVLWKAVDSYVPAKGGFGPYWWSLWLNRRHDIASAYFAVKRIHPILTESVPDAGYGERLFPLPPDTDATGARIWGSLARGDTPKEVQEDTGVSRRRYYDYLRQWRTKEVRDGLRDA